MEKLQHFTKINVNTFLKDSTARLKSPLRLTKLQLQASKFLLPARGK